MHGRTCEEIEEKKHLSSVNENAIPVENYFFFHSEIPFSVSSKAIRNKGTKGIRTKRRRKEEVEEKKMKELADFEKIEKPKEEKTINWKSEKWKMSLNILCVVLAC